MSKLAKPPQFSTRLLQSTPKNVNKLKEMTPSLRFLCLSLAIVSASAAQTPAAPARPLGHSQPTTAPAAKAAPPLFEQVCKLTNHADICIEALKKEPIAQTADARQLAAIIVRLAYQNGTETMGFITGILAGEKEHPPKTEQCLTDCAELYELALQQLDGATAALDEMVVDRAANNHAMKWITEALGHVETCEVGCKEWAEHKKVISEKNNAIGTLCSTAVSIIVNLA